jgi:hypothetical protein
MAGPRFQLFLRRGATAWFSAFSTSRRDGWFSAFSARRRDGVVRWLLLAL